MTKPPYISWLGHGATSLAPPGVFTDATSYAFMLDASAEAMQALVDKILTPATQGKVVYRVAAAATIVSVLDIAQCSSGTDSIGWLPGREVAIWVPLMEEIPGSAAQRLVFWAPYIFINYDIGMVTGREVWGWPKAIGEIIVEPTATQARFACHTTIFDKLGAQTKGSFEELIAITGTRPITPSPGDLIECASALFGDLVSAFVDFFRVEPVVPAIALKQFRDSADPTRASHQAIVNSPCRVTTMKRFELLDDSFTLTIKNCDSHCIMQDIFGEKPTGQTSQLTVRVAGRLHFDFNAEPGETIVAWP